MTSRKFIFLLATFVSAQSGNDQLSVDTELINFDKILNQPIIDDERCDIYTDYFREMSKTPLPNPPDPPQPPPSDKKHSKMLKNHKK